MTTESNLRIDKWLWAVRIYKTRNLATEACKKDKVIVDGIAVKPSRNVKVNEVIFVKKNPVIYKFRVKALLGKRVGAKLVSEYLEDLTPESELYKLEMIRDAHTGYRRKGLGRPTKRERRIIDRFTDRHTDS